jgi:competence protein ComEC
MNQTPFLRLLIPFLAGMLLRYHSWPEWIMTGFIVLSVIFLALHFAWGDMYGNRWFFGIFIIFFCLAGGMWLMSQSLEKTEWKWGSEAIVCSGVMMDYPVEKKQTVMCRLQLSSIDTKVVVYLPKDSLSLALIPGSKLALRCRFDSLKRSEAVDFDYEWYLKKKGFSAIGFVREGCWRQTSCESAWKYAALRYRTHLIAVMEKMGLSRPAFALNVAMTFGHKGLLDEDISQSFRLAGISHLIAISGLHVQILFAGCCLLLSSLGGERRRETIRYLLVLHLIWAYVFITGLPPSLVRAAVMISFYGLGKIFSVQVSTLNIVYASAMLMLLYDPLYLFDIGFQLSYIAVLSIVMIYPLIEQLYETSNPAVRYFWQSLSISIAAQLGTAPLCIYYFHCFPLYFWITNMVAVPLSAPLLSGTLISIGVQSVLTLPSWVFEPIEWLLQAMIHTAGAVGELPLSEIPDLHPDEIQTILFYAILLAGISFFKTGSVRSIYLFQLFVLLQVILYL